MTLIDSCTDRRIVLRLFSGAWLEGAADGLRLTARKKIALLAYLALERACAPRDLLAGLIWGEVSDTKARASLRQALSDLRAAHPVLDKALVIDRTTVTLVPDRITLETDLIIEALHQGRLPDALRCGGETVNDILYGFEAVGDRFGDWVRDMRQISGDRILRALREAALRSDLPTQTRMAFAQSAVQLDPLGECTCRFAMQLAWDLGDVAKALNIYAAFYQRMDAEMDMVPSFETQDLAAQIKMEAGSPPSTPEAHPPSPQASLPPSPQDAQPLAQPRPSPATARAPAPPPTSVGRAPRHHGRPVLALLPMRTSGLGGDDAGLGDLLVENMTLRITRTEDLSVVSQVSIRPLADRPDVAQVLLDTLGVRYVVSGHIRRIKDRYLLNVELTKTDEGLVLWADRFDTTEADLAAAQSRIADAIVNRLLPNLHLAEREDTQQIDLAHLGAYHHLLRAQDLVYALSPKTFAAAGRQLQDIITTWPDFAPAQVMVSDWYSLRIGQGWSRDRAADLALSETHLVRALKARSPMGRALAMLGHKRAVYGHRHAEARALFKEALATSAGDAETLLWTGPALAFAGQTDEAIARLERARSLTCDTPLGFRYDHFLALAYFAADRMEDALSCGLASHRRNGGYTSNLRLTAAAAMATGQTEIAADMAARAMTAEPDFRIRRLAARDPFRIAATGARYRALLTAAGLPA